MAIDPDVAKQVNIVAISPQGGMATLNTLTGENGVVSASFDRYEAQRKLIDDAERLASRWRDVFPFHTIKVVLI